MTTQPRATVVLLNLTPNPEGHMEVLLNGEKNLRYSVRSRNKFGKAKKCLRKVSDNFDKRA